MFYFKILLPDLKMLYSELIAPVARALYSIMEHVFASTAILIGAGGVSEILELGLFDTPTMWWQGLLYLVIIDWASGVAIAVIDGNFSFSIMNEKWRQVIGYTASCAMAAILANGFPNVFYYFQFLIYVSFFLKEGISILKTFKLLAFVRVIKSKLNNGGSLLDGDLNAEVQEQAEKSKHPKVKFEVEKEPYEENA
jgi:hypothetical protein